MKKRLLCLLLALILCLGAASPALAARATSFESGLAADLKTLGLFKGVSDTDFALDRQPTRVEALVMLIRLLGREDAALSGTWAHPFTDVPAWAGPYVGYAYENGLTSGVSATRFGLQSASAGMFLTFTLRALGYSDAAGDFSWADPLPLARTAGILPSFTDTQNFLRADAAAVSYAALAANLKGEGRSLADKLIAEGVFTRTQFAACYDAGAIARQEAALTPAAPARDIPGKANYHGHVYTGGASSKRYHYESRCAGKNSREITWEEVDRRGLTPCGTCVLK